MHWSMKVFGVFVLVSLAWAGFAQDGEWVEKPSGLKYRIIKNGKGPVAKVGQVAAIHETTSKMDGTLVFNSRDLGHAIKILIGGNQAIQGVDEGIRGMRVGERRELWVPAALAKRTVYPDSISPEDDLKYVVDLVGLE